MNFKIDLGDPEQTGGGHWLHQGSGVVLPDPPVRRLRVRQAADRARGQARTAQLSFEFALFVSPSPRRLSR
jgi:hypothetical protein